MARTVYSDCMVHMDYRLNVEDVLRVVFNPEVALSPARF